MNPPEEKLDAFKGKYRTSSARLPFYDYGSNGGYFVTICTKNRQHFFGEIVDAKMDYSPAGEIAKKYWKEIPQHFPFVELASFVIMPNHVHGIIIIDKNNREVLHAKSLHTERSKRYQGYNSQLSEISPQKYSLSSILRSYKSAVSKKARETLYHFAWQPRFHDHVIRNEKDFFRISEYIENNPLRWKEDVYFD